MDDVDSIRALVGADAMQTMDLIDSDVFNAIEEFIPHLLALTSALAGWDLHRRTMFLIGLVTQAAAEAG